MDRPLSHQRGFHQPMWSSQGAPVPPAGPPKVVLIASSSSSSSSSSSANRPAPGFANPGDLPGVMIGDLPVNIKENDLRAAFSKCGTVAHVRLPRDRASNKIRGFGFVRFGSKKDVETALKEGVQLPGGPYIDFDSKKECNFRFRGLRRDRDPDSDSGDSAAAGTKKPVYYVRAPKRQYKAEHQAENVLPMMLRLRNQMNESPGAREKKRDSKIFHDKIEKERPYNRPRSLEQLLVNFDSDRRIGQKRKMPVRDYSSGAAAVREKLAAEKAARRRKRRAEQRDQDINAEDADDDATGRKRTKLNQEGKMLLGGAIKQAERTGATLASKQESRSSSLSAASYHSELSSSEFQFSNPSPVASEDDSDCLPIAPDLRLKLNKKVFPIAPDLRLTLNQIIKDLTDCIEHGMFNCDDDDDPSLAEQMYFPGASEDRSMESYAESKKHLWPDADPCDIVCALMTMRASFEDYSDEEVQYEYPGKLKEKKTSEAAARSCHNAALTSSATASILDKKKQFDEDDKNKENQETDNVGNVVVAQNRDQKEVASLLRAAEQSNKGVGNKVNKEQHQKTTAAAGRAVNDEDDSDDEDDERSLSCVSEPPASAKGTISIFSRRGRVMAHNHALRMVGKALDEFERTGKWTDPDGKRRGLGSCSRSSSYDSRKPLGLAWRNAMKGISNGRSVVRFTGRDSSKGKAQRHDDKSDTKKKASHTNANGQTAKIKTVAARYGLESDDDAEDSYNGSMFSHMFDEYEALMYSMGDDGL